MTGATIHGTFLQTFFTIFRQFITTFAFETIFIVSNKPYDFKLPE